MPRWLVISLLLGADFALASCLPAEAPHALDISITSNAFVMRGAEYKSKGELTTALKMLNPPTAISLRQESGTSAERRAEALAAITDAGIKAPVAIVGNEVFSK